MRASEGPFPMETIYSWSAFGKNTTQMTLRNRGNPKGISKLFVPIMASMMKKATTNDLANLKKISE